MKRACLTFVLLFMLLSPVRGQEFMTEQGYVEFTSRAPLTSFKGKSSNLTGLVDLGQNLVDFYVDLTTIDTGIDLRNRHMRDRYLETERFPFAEFTGKLISEFDPALSDTQQVQVEGEFTIHGITMERVIDGRIYVDNENLYLEAEFNVLLEDHEIQRPKVVFYELAEKQEVFLKGTLKKQ